MGNIKELLAQFKDEIVTEITEKLSPDIDGIDQKVEDAVAGVMVGLKGEEEAKDRLYVLSQDKKLLMPITYATVKKASDRNPKSAEYPFVITARCSVYTNDIIGWYKDENSAIAELQNLFKALKFANKNEYAVYEMK